MINFEKFKCLNFFIIFHISLFQIVMFFTYKFLLMKKIKKEYLI